jgi:methionyl-tRNA formyltransferase
MIKKSKAIIFFGTDDFSLITLKALTTSGYNISAIITKIDKPSGRGHKVHYSPVKQFAVDNNIQYFQPNNGAEMFHDVSSINGARIGILSSFGKLISLDVINLFEYGIINIHPSLLPKYRGPSPVESAILNGDDYTGVSIMLLSEKMDDGDIYCQKKVHLTKKEDQAELYKKLGELGSNTLTDILPNIIDNRMAPFKQDASKATYCSLINKNDAIIAPETTNAIDAERKIRAYSSYPKVRIRYRDDEIIVLSSHLQTEDEKTDNAIVINFMDKKNLIIDKILAKSGKIISSKDYLNGYCH